jgi:hypothetical protein
MPQLRRDVVAHDQLGAHHRVRLAATAFKSRGFHVDASGVEGGDDRLQVRFLVGLGAPSASV